MRWVAAIAMLLALAAPASAQTIDPQDLLGTPEVTAAASPAEVQLGARFVLVVTATYDDGVVVNITSPLDLGPTFEERRRSSKDSVRADGKHVREWQIEVFAWDLGELEIPPVQVTFTRAGTAGAVMTNGVPIRVIGTLGDMVDTAQPRGDAPPVGLRRTSWFWVTLIASMILAALVASLLVWLGLRRRRRVQLVVPVPMTARVSGLFRRPRLGATAEEALARLEAIESSGMLARDRRAAYTEMIDTIQLFLGRQLGADLEDKTTGELREWLAEARLADATRAEIRRWLDDCELVKFGGVRPSVDEGKIALGVARELVMAVAMPTAAPAEERAVA